MPFAAPDISGGDTVNLVTLVTIDGKLMIDEIVSTTGALQWNEVRRYSV
jgi:hypothetical protein